MVQKCTTGCHLLEATRDDGDDGEILQIRFIKIVMKMDITVTYYNEVKNGVNNGE